jgi:two-component system OmpR family response regulator
MRILLVEDNQRLAEQVAKRVRSAGFCVDHAATLETASAALADHAYPIIVLDRRLPDGDGLAMLPEIRRRNPASRVLLLTALDTIDDRVAGLDAGADDYLIKPCDLEELMARIRANLRRTVGDCPPPPVTVGALVFDLGARTASVAGRPALFHNRELALLESLVRRAGVIVRRETLMSEIWGFDDEVHPHALTILVGRLRARLEELETGAQIHSSRGVGYMIAEKAP